MMKRYLLLVLIGAGSVCASDTPIQFKDYVRELYKDKKGAAVARSEMRDASQDKTPFVFPDAPIPLPVAPDNTSQWTVALALCGNAIARGIGPKVNYETGTVEADGEIQLLECSGNAVTVTDTVTMQCPLQVVLSNEGKLGFLASTFASNAGALTNYTVQTFSGERIVFPPQPHVSGNIASIDDEARWMVSSNDGDLSLYDLTKPADQTPVSLSRGKNFRIFAFADNGDSLPKVAMANYDEVQLWDNGTLTSIIAGQPTDVPHNVTYAYYGVTFSPDGERAYVTGNDFVWEYDCDQKETKALKAYTANEDSGGVLRGIASALNRSGKFMLIADPVWGLLCYDMSTGEVMGSLVKGAGIGFGWQATILSFDTHEGGEKRFVQTSNYIDTYSDSVVQFVTKLTQIVPRVQEEPHSETQAGQTGFMSRCAFQ